MKRTRENSLRFLFLSLCLLKVGWWEGVATDHDRVRQRQTWMNAEVCLVVPMILMVRSGKDHKTPRPSLRKAWMWALGFLCFVAVLKQSCLHAFNDKNESLPQIPNVCLYQEPLSHAPEFLLYQWQLRNHPISQLHRCHPAHSRHYPYGNCLCLNKHRDQYCVINLTPSHHDIKGRNTPVVLEIKANPERWDDLSTATRSRGEDRRDQVFRFQIHCCLKKKTKRFILYGV